MGYDMTIRHDGQLSDKEEYFRLNMFGMAEYARAMLEIGMMHHSPFPTQDEWPVAPNTGDGDADEAAHEAMLQPILARHNTDNPTLPSHKFGSNDGWIVTRSEIEAALAWWDGLDEFAPPLSPRTAETVAEDYWQEWIAFLRRAADHGGFRVY